MFDLIFKRELSGTESTVKKPLWLLLLLCLCVTSSAQTNPPVKLALIAGSDDAAEAVDLLTAQLAANNQVQLLERDQIDQVRREQAQSAVNRDDLQLGRLLGANGMLNLEVVRTPTATNLLARLIAVQPGVVLTDGAFPWPLQNPQAWADSVSTYLHHFLPKLAVPLPNAIPVSLVNFRSAIASAEAPETERQLKLLAIQRLSQEQPLFVLERQKMQLLGEEKDLNADESAFWNGSYLLEGVIDQNGYSPDKLTLDGRLTPPKGGVPLTFQISGNRTNLADIVNQLAAKVTSLLKINSTVKEWNSADEANQYYQEANWALKWGIYGEAQAAADSAWALGKQDMDCATVRIKSYEQSISLPTISEEGAFDSSITDNTNPANQAWLARKMKQMTNSHQNVFFDTNDLGIGYLIIDDLPNPNTIICANHSLELYYDYTRNNSSDILSVRREANSAYQENSPWYNLGLENLGTASQVLLYFYLEPNPQGTMRAELSELRVRVRAVADLMYKSSSIRDRYFVGSRLATHDELGDIYSKPNIFSSTLRWGSLWQERPEDTIALYRNLMESPAFCYIHAILWSHLVQLPKEVHEVDHRMEPPRLVAWQEQDRQRIPQLWENLVKDLNDSTNVLWQLEAKAFEFADAANQKTLGVAYTNFFDALFAHSEELLNNPVEQFYADWGADDLVSLTRGLGPLTFSTPDDLKRQFYSGYWPKLTGLQQEYWGKTVPAFQFKTEFEEQKQYLKSNETFDFIAYTQLFQQRNYSRSQALEIQPLVASYKSNLVSQSQSAIGAAKGPFLAAINQITELETEVNRIINPPVPSPTPQAVVAIPNPVPAKPAPAQSAAARPPEVTLPVFAVTKSYTIPLEHLVSLDRTERIDPTTQVTVTAHHWMEGKLLLNFDYNLHIDQFYADGTRNMLAQTGQAIAVLDPDKNDWNVIDCPSPGLFGGPAKNTFYHHTALLHGTLYNSDGGKIQKYAPQAQQWETLAISDGNNYELFVVNDHFYAANGNTIFEILDDGQKHHLLASTRRNPPVSVLDSQDLGTPTLFPGPNHSVRLSTGKKIFRLAGNDWQEEMDAPSASFVPDISPEGALFRSAGDSMDLPASVSFLPMDTNSTTLFLSQKIPHPGVITTAWPNHTTSPPKPVWPMPPSLFLANLPAAILETNLYLFVDHSTAQKVQSEQPPLGIIGEKFLPKDGYHAVLLCFSPGLPQPQKLYLTFDPSHGRQPLTGIGPDAHTWFAAKPPVWMFFSNGYLFLGLEQANSAIPVTPSLRTDFCGQVTVWMAPVSEIEAAITAQRQGQIAALAQTMELAQKAKAALLEKYDLNHNGVLDPSEKEEALTDTNFIESQLDQIDANHNNRLDADELAYFDANQNQTLDPNEQKGIEITQHLLAEKLIKQFDLDGDGVLDHVEFTQLLQANTAASPRPMPLFMSEDPDKNHDHVIDCDELSSYLQQETLRALRPHRIPGMPEFHPLPPNMQPHLTEQQLFKSRVDAYWQATP